MATVSDIQQVASYRGDANLGGGNVGVVDPRIDMQAWQRLADFTFIKRRAEHEQQQKEFDQAVSSAAKDLSIDWSKILPQHREEIMRERELVRKFAREHPDSWSQNSKYFGELQSLKNEFMTKANAAISRGIEHEVGMEQARKNSLSSSDLSAYEGEMNKRIGGIYDKISPFADFNLKPLDLTAGQEKIATDVALPNYIETTEGQIVDMGQVWGMADTVPIDQDLRPGMGDISAQRAMAKGFNDIITNGYLKDPKYAITNADGSFGGFTALAKGDQSTVGKLVRDIEAVNEEIRKYNTLSSGSQVKPIDPANGIDETEANMIIIFKKSLAARSAAEAKKSLKLTGLADKMAIAKMEEWGRNKRSADEIAAAVEAAKAKGDKTAEQLLTDATAFSNRIYSLIESSGKAKLIPVNSLSDEEKQVLGIIRYANDGTVVNKAGADGEGIDPAKLVLYIGPKGGIALAKKDGDKYKTIDSYSRESLKSARVSYIVSKGSGKEFGVYGELGGGSSPAPSTAPAGETEAQRFLRESQ